MLEFERWTPHFKVIQLKPTKGEREDILEEMYRGDFDVCVTTYEALRYVPEVITKFKWYYLVFDEAHKLKNSESQSYKAAWKFKC